MKTITAITVFLLLTFSLHATDRELMHPLKVGNPMLELWPVSGDPANSLPRSIWEMQFFNNRIYLGCGDYWNNRGPIDVWSLGADGFCKEMTDLQEEMINFFFVSNGKLFMPGLDPKEDGSLGNLYIKDPNVTANKGWIRRTIPTAILVGDMADFKGNYYISVVTGYNRANILRSSDGGQTWSTLIPGRGGRLLAFDEFLLISEETNNMITYRYDGVKLRKVEVWLPRFFAARIIRFGPDALYVDTCLYTMSARGFYLLRASEVKDGGQVVRVDSPGQGVVLDILTRGTNCYVLTAEEIKEAIKYRGRIYSSVDLHNWKLVADFILPGVPYSFELLGESFYVGLGVKNSGQNGWNCRGSESGSIWRIDIGQQMTKTGSH